MLRHNYVILCHDLLLSHYYNLHRVMFTMSFKASVHLSGMRSKQPVYEGYEKLYNRHRYHNVSFLMTREE